MQLRLVIVGAVVGAGVVLLGACGSGDDEATTTTVELSAAAQEGQQIAEAQGCTSCHQVTGDDGIGPAWSGLAGSQVELADGSTVVADEEYLTTAIQDPNAQVVKGFNGIMPQRTLDDDQVAALVAYLQELGTAR